jgi:D-glycero-alpha-D-manno-heptose 1-phosphate guanylyltransferase
MQAIILAGGFGTRLQSVIKDVPKPMADINSKPFLEYILKYLQSYGVSKAILSVGYKQEVIKDYFGNNYKDIKILYSSEDEPLGTGGAIKQAIEYTDDDMLLVLNGDTLFDVALDEFYSTYTSKDNNHKSDIVIALKQMSNVDRYGAVKIDKNSTVTAFTEKKFYEKTYINGGVYLIKREIFKDIQESKFSFEEFLESSIDNLNVYGDNIASNRYFIDIGIPTDYAKAQDDFKEIFKG